MRVNQGLPIIDKEYNKHLDWEFLFTMKQNEMFVFPGDGFEPSEIDLLDPKNKKLISKNLFRGQKFSFTGYKYVFRHHLETDVDVKKELDNVAYKQFANLNFANDIVKVRINHLGDIVSVGEY